jgi:hypothetical protein
VGCWWPNAAADVGTGRYIPDLSQYQLELSYSAGTPLPWAAGQLPGESTIHLTGLGYFSTADAAHLNILNGAHKLTATTLINLDAESNQVGLLCSLSGWYDGWGLRLAGPKLYFSRGDSHVISDDAITLGVWHLLAGVFEDHVISVYVDGELASTPQSCPPPIGTTPGIAVGRDGVYNHPFTGYLSNAALWNRALAPEEIAWLYREPAAMIWEPGRKRTFIFSAAGGESLAVESAVALYASETYTVTRGLEVSASETLALTRAMETVGQEVATLTRALELSASETATLTRALEAYGLEALTALRSAEVTAQEVQAVTRAIEAYAQEIATITRGIGVFGTGADTSLLEVSAWGADLQTVTRGLAVAAAQLLTVTRGVEVSAQESAALTRSLSVSGADALTVTRMLETWGLGGVDEYTATHGILVWAISVAVGIRDVLLLVDQRDTLKTHDERDTLSLH